MVESQVPQQTRDAPSQPHQLPYGQQLGTPQQTHDAPSQPHQMPYGQQPGQQPAYAPPPQQHAGVAPTPLQQSAQTQHTRSPTDSALDKPPKNMRPLYAAVVGAVVLVIVLILLLT